MGEFAIFYLWNSALLWRFFCLFAVSSKELHNMKVKSKIKEELSGQESEYSLALVERVCCVHRVKCD